MIENYGIFTSTRTSWWILLLNAAFLTQICAGAVRVGTIYTPEEVYQCAEFLQDQDVHIELIEQPDATFAYDRMKQVHKRLRNKTIDVIIDSYHESIEMCAEQLGIPYIVTSLSSSSIGSNVTTHMFPDADYIASALLEMTSLYHWSNFAVIYENLIDTSLMDAIIDKNKATIKFWRVSQPISESKLSNMVRTLRDDNFSDFLLLTSTMTTRRIFEKARSLGVIARPYNWVVLNLGSDNIWSGILDDLRTNVTVLTLLDEPIGSVTNLTKPLWQFSCVVFADAIMTYMNARNHTLETNRYPTKRDVGLALKSELPLQGMTGNLQFNQDGQRTNLTFAFMFFDGMAYTKIGEWISKPGENKEHDGNLRIYPFIPLPSLGQVFPLEGRTVNVVTILEPPWTMLKEDHEARKGNDRFEGFIIDFAAELGQMLNFKYNLYLVPDGNFGGEMENGEWNGMIGEVLGGRASMTLAPLSINSAREDVVDFTKPFKTRGITVLISVPRSQPWYFEFMSPLSNSVWLTCFVALVTVSVALYIMERYGTHQRQAIPDLDKSESAWFIFGSIVGGSTESTPVTVPGRILTSAWWFFALILVSTYTANLAAFLTVKKMQPPITSLSELADQSKIRYGTVINSGVSNYFETTNLDPFRGMWSMMSELGTLVNSTAEGINKTKEDNYAFLWDSTVTGYLASKDCDLMEVGPPIDPKGFGIAVPPGALYRDELSMAILRLADMGKLNELDHKWWMPSPCPQYDNSNDETTALELENVAGIFFVLLAGLSLSFFALCLDRIHVYLRNRPCRKKKAPETFANNLDIQGSTSL